MDDFSGWFRFTQRVKARYGICINTGRILRMFDIGTNYIRLSTLLFTIFIVHVQAYLDLIIK